MEAQTAYEGCLKITKQQARNFYFGIRLLPRKKRNALCALYALARLMDDIVDDDIVANNTVDEDVSRSDSCRDVSGVNIISEDNAGENAANVLPKDIKKLAALDNLSKKIQQLKQGKTDNFDVSAPLWGVYYATKEFPIPLDALDELISGCKRDAASYKYETYEDMVGYCRLVAGSVGRLSLGVFGIKNSSAYNDLTSQLADELGIALQITNILRDILEDKAMGRCYLPNQDLERFNISPDFEGSLEDKKSLILFEVDRAMEWYQKGFELLKHLDRKSFACAATMAGIYFNLLKKIQKNPEAVFEKRVSLSTNKKIRVALKSLAHISPIPVNS